MSRASPWRTTAEPWEGEEAEEEEEAVEVVVEEEATVALPARLASLAATASIDRVSSSR